MATKDQQNEEARKQKLHVQQRRALGNAHTALLADQNTQSFQAFTFEDAVDLQIERIEGEGSQLRPNLLGRVDRIEAELVSAVEQLKKVPEEAFLQPDPERDVNTPQNPE